MQRKMPKEFHASNAENANKMHVINGANKKPLPSGARIFLFFKKRSQQKILASVA